ncbi:MAG TPA: hypothetical protein VG498_05935 [Terriglobales bacterium]|nr:hypothetical protein [Terriglobales bacterium]
MVSFLQNPLGELSKVAGEIESSIHVIVSEADPVSRNHLFNT